MRTPAHLTRRILLSAVVLTAAGALTFTSATPIAAPGASRPALTTVTFDPATPVRLVAFGDSGTRTQTQYDLAAAITADGPYDAVLHTGDLVYPHGDPDLIVETLDGPYPGLTRTPWIAAPGNHDEESDAADQILTHLGARTIPYRIQVGPAAIYVLDSFTDLDTQITWLTRTAGTDTAAFKVALTHAPALTCARHKTDPAVTAARTTLLPALDAARFDLLLSGHDHTYQRFTRPGATTQIVTGGGGADLYPIEACPTGVPAPDAAISVHHYLTLEVTGTGITVTARTGDGIIDRVELPVRRR